MRQSISFRRTLAYACMVVALASQPLAVFAQSVEPGAVNTSETKSADATPTPTSADQPPAASAEPKRTYGYNEDTGRWDSDKWTYNPTTRKYEPTPQPVPVAEPARGTDMVEEDDATHSLEAVSSSDIKNVLDSLATSGSAVVDGNTTASHATSGDASATATIINNLNSSVSNSDNAKAATFVTDIMGDVNGDIMLKPMLLKAMLEAEAGTTSNSMNIQNSSTITNDINLSATSGDASVTKNTTAGNATTGSANTVANVVNIVNSMIAANRSFIGTINIYGNLDGDILIAPDFIPQLLASNSVQDNTPFASPKTLTVDAEDTQSIINNVNLSAASGNATVASNTTAGDATTGAANTNTVIFNMTGHEVVAKNSLLVFVNVLGTWVGVIVDAPTGATSAVIGNGVTTNAVQSPDIAITAENNVQITNNLTLNSLTGDALVANNTTAGNATSGNATASANIANITNSQFGLSDWFGVLYINVFGNWLGSLGIDTSAGSRPVGTERPTATGSDKPIEFIPRGSRPLSASRIVPLVFGYASATLAESVTAVQESAGEVLAVQADEADQQAVGAGATRTDNGSGFSLMAALSFMGGLGLLGSTMRKKNSLFRLGHKSSTVA